MSRSIVSSFIRAATFLALPLGAEAAATLRVPQQYSSIQAAIDAAVDGDTVLVSDGQFGGATIDGKNIELASVHGAGATVLSGSTQRSMIQLIDTKSHVHGFTVADSNAGQGDAGGGIFVLGGAPTIDGMIITGNEALFGGGIFISGSNASVHHNRITQNAGEQGGGIYIEKSNALVSDNEIEDNNAYGSGEPFGSGIMVSGGASTILRNVIRGNGASREVDVGGGIFAYGFDEPGTLLVADNLIVGNAAYEGGGVAVWADKHGKSRWINNTIADNTADTIGPQVYTRSGGRGIIFANNAISGAEDAAVYCWRDGAGSPIFDHNDVYPGAAGKCAQAVVTGTNLTLPPAFTNGANGHPYHLAPDSPLVDAGNNQAVQHLHHDLGMRPRIIDGGHGAVVDIGAYEFRP